jgi:hypothetical protein
LRSAKQALKGIERPEQNATLEEHRQYLDAWCKVWFDKGKANKNNKRYLRPTIATPGELREKSKEAGSFWWTWRCK